MKKSRFRLLLAAVICLTASRILSLGQKFAPDWTSLEQYKCPEWFHDAKLGIFLH